MVHASCGENGPSSRSVQEGSDSGLESREPKSLSAEAQAGEGGAEGEGCMAQDEDGPLHESVLWGVADVLREDSGGSVPAGEEGASALMSQMQQQQQQQQHSSSTGGGKAQPRAPLFSHQAVDCPAPSGNCSHTSAHAPKFVDIPASSSTPLSSSNNMPSSSTLLSYGGGTHAPKFLGGHGFSSQAAHMQSSSRRSSAAASRGRARPPRKASIPARTPLPLPSLAGVASSKAAAALDPAQYTVTVAASKAAAALAPPKPHARTPLSPEEAAAEAAAAAARASAGLLSPTST